MNEHLSDYLYEWSLLLSNNVLSTIIATRKTWIDAKIHWPQLRHVVKNKDSDWEYSTPRYT